MIEKARIAARLKLRLKYFSDKLNRTESTIVNDAIEFYLDHLEQKIMLNFEQQKDAEAIANEINQAWNAGDSELCKYREMGYMGEIGSPHDWWELNCKAYSIASEKYPKAKEFAAICRTADQILNNVK